MTFQIPSSFRVILLPVFGPFDLFDSLGSLCLLNLQTCRSAVLRQFKMADESTTKKILNFNVGVLGHVDSGKTALAKALSTTASTACFDKNPQSRERGITLDLGFSSFHVPFPSHLEAGGKPYDLLQFTLVDCPGHASLIRTIIGGAQIIDMMVLVVDVTKGMQTQTAECLVIGGILCEKMIVVLNKVDLLKEDKKDALLEKITKRIRKTLETTVFAKSPIISVAAKPGGPEAPDTEPVGISRLMELLTSMSYIPERILSGNLLYAVDHCFSIRGQGTVMTGTVLSGSIGLNDVIEIPSLKVTKKVKSIQMFKQPIKCAYQGDRVGVCVTQFDPKLLERGIVCTPSSVPTVFGGIASVKKIPYYKGSISTKSKFHITVGHETVMGRIRVFGASKATNKTENDGFSFEQEYVHQEELLDLTKTKASLDNTEDAVTDQPLPEQQWLLVEFEKPVICPEHSLVIGSRLDTDIHLNMCRIAFHGKLLVPLLDKNYSETLLPQLQVYKTKYKEGIVERMLDEYSVIGRSLFKKETNIQIFTGMKITLSTGEEGVIEGAFGQSGKIKVRIPAGLSKETAQRLQAVAKKKGGKGKAGDNAPTPASAEETVSKDEGAIKIKLQFKRFIHDSKKKMVQA
ncbi:hypothetical protein QZH41_014192 [Actinostola sp. cb2023]|nr:hypothetical protein QZH41_014192 [Actinostola sp. cb2023]